MADSPWEKTMGRSTASTVQLSLPIAPVSLQESEGRWEIVASEASIEVQQRIEVIQQLIAAQGTEGYGKLQQQASFVTSLYLKLQELEGLRMAKKHFAISREMEEIVASLSPQSVPKFLRLLEKGERVDARQRSNGATLLMLAIRARIPHLVELLIEKGADIDAKDMEGVTPLMEAVLANDVETVKLLLEKGANPNKKTRSGFTAITWAIVLMSNDEDKDNPFTTNNHNKYEEIVELIRQSGGQ